MSPLEVDDEYRGAHALHVHPHPKLGKCKPHEGVHRSVIEAALPLMNWLIDDDDVTKVTFGKLSHAGGKSFKPRVECVLKKSRLVVLLVDKSTAQFFGVHTASHEAAQKVAKRIEAKWATDVLHTGGLKAV